MIIYIYLYIYRYIDIYIYIKSTTIIQVLVMILWKKDKQTDKEEKIGERRRILKINWVMKDL